MNSANKRAEVYIVCDGVIWEVSYKLVAKNPRARLLDESHVFLLDFYID